MLLFFITLVLGNHKTFNLNKVNLLSVELNLKRFFDMPSKFRPGMNVLEIRLTIDPTEFFRRFHESSGVHPRTWCGK